jgi:hypothetical protein
MAGRAQGTSLSIGAYSTMFIYVKNVVILMYFIVEGRIDTFGEEIQPSDWLKLSEARSARANAGRQQRCPRYQPLWQKFRKSSASLSELVSR